MKTNIIISCEHAGNKIPKFIKNKINIPHSILNSHRGYDKGALEITKKFSKKLNKTPQINKISRLIIDYNRSLNNKNIWSSYTSNISEEDKEKLIKSYSHYREIIQKKINHKNIHLSIHSFTPIKNGIKRNCDFAVLYDPNHSNEKMFAKKIKERLTKEKINCRLNYPYKGTSDGLTSFFRKKIGKNYLGLELEFNQKIIKNKKKINSILNVLYQICDECAKDI
ncbi:MAG: N-formylglutamate amidohydrolase [Bdellovibrionaceae bacterium]|nr:N-formylglutamate amidohydrolase [Pseudobdellovibrionaceae bacterium]|tara:strand:- start:5548 stop:6219 length:672 start_codon:yes stop_codon:yes gene_type:complete